MPRDVPKQPHYKVIYDAYIETGRTDVSDLIEQTLRKVQTQKLMFPDLYVHEVTAALIKAGIIPAEAPEAEKSKVHHVKTDIDWAGSGRDGDPWVMVSWDVKRCECDTPWTHEALA